MGCVIGILFCAFSLGVSLPWVVAIGRVWMVWFCLRICCQVVVFWVYYMVSFCDYLCLWWFRVFWFWGCNYELIWFAACGFVFDCFCLRFLVVFCSCACGLHLFWVFLHV